MSEKFQSTFGIDSLRNIPKEVKRSLCAHCDHMAYSEKKGNKQNGSIHTHDLSPVTLEPINKKSQNLV